MARQTLRINGSATPTGTLVPTPIIPVKTQEQLLLEAELDRLRKENEGLRNRPQSRLSLKVSEKGAVSVYGMGRFPITLYREQWERLLAMADEVKAFIQANSAYLKIKGQD